MKSSFEERLRDMLKDEAYGDSHEVDSSRVVNRIRASSPRSSAGWVLSAVAAGGLTVAAIGLSVGLTGRDPASGTSSSPDPASSPSVTGELVAIPTQAPWTDSSPQPCPAAVLFGTLVADASGGVALSTDFGERVTLIWPYGYVALLTAGTLEVIDASGRAIAQEGDRLAVGGGEFGHQDPPTWRACGDVEVLPPE